MPNLRHAPIKQLAHKIKGCGHPRISSFSAQIKEARCKAIRHYICCIIQSMYELNLKPKFWSEAA